MKVRNLFFIKKMYKFFSQKRDPTLSQGIMEDPLRKLKK